MSKEELQKVNEALREDLENVCFINKIVDEEKTDFWKTIGLLIDNEIEQEKFCNQ